MKKLIFTFAILCTMLWSCGDSGIRPRLDRADALMESHPDSALKLLCGIDTLALDDAEDIGRYNLLMGQSLYKNYYDSESMPYIVRSLDYFRQNGSDFDRMRSFYYNAMIEGFYEHDYYNATLHILFSKYYADRQNDQFWRAKVSDLLADIYSLTYNHSEALHYALEAEDLYKKSGKEYNSRYSRCTVASSYGNLGKLNHGIAILDSLKYLTLHEQQPDTMLLNYILEQSIHLRINNNDLETARQEYDSLRLLGQKVFNPFERQFIETKLALNEKDPYIELKLRQMDSISSSDAQRSEFCYLNALHLLNVNKSDSAVIMLDSAIYYQSESFTQLLEQASIKAERKFSETKTAELTKHNKSIICYIRIIAIGSVVFIISLILLLKFRNIKTQAQLNQLKSEILLLNSKNRDLLNINDDNNKAFLRQSWTAIESICSHFPFIGAQNLGETNPEKYKRELDKANANILSILHDIGTDESIQKLSCKLDASFNNIISALREIPKISESDIRLACLIIARCPIGAIAIILNKKLKTLYTQRSRAIAKIQQSDSSRKEELISHLELSQ